MIVFGNNLFIEMYTVELHSRAFQRRYCTVHFCNIKGWMGKVLTVMLLLSLPLIGLVLERFS